MVHGGSGAEGAVEGLLTQYEFGAAVEGAALLGGVAGQGVGTGEALGPEQFLGHALGPQVVHHRLGPLHGEVQVVVLGASAVRMAADEDGQALEVALEQGGLARQEGQGAGPEGGLIHLEGEARGVFEDQHSVQTQGLGHGGAAFPEEEAQLDLAVRQEAHPLLHGGLAVQAGPHQGHGLRVPPLSVGIRFT